VIEPRLYRAAFIPALVATILAMFSLEARPRPLPQGLAADVLFDGNIAAGSARAIATAAPDRRPGTRGDLATASRVAGTLAARGFSVERVRFSHDDKQLVNVVGRRSGKSRRQIVVVAPRDAAAVPDVPGSAGDTAALLELARVFEGRPSQKTLVLASVDGSTLGESGASQLADRLGDPGLVDGVLVMSDLGAKRRKGGAIVPWSNGSERAGIALQRTAAASLREELNEPAGSTSVSGQLARLAFPIGIGAQGVFLESGYDSLRISGSGELPPEGSGPASALDPDRLGGLGRTTLRTVTALDQGPTPEHGPGSYVIAVSQVLPGWVIAVLALGFLIPVLVASVDAFARVRRRRMAVAPWLLWLGAAALPFVVGLALAELLSLLDATPTHAGAPVAPDLYPLDGAALGVLGGLTVAVAAVFWLLRRAVVATDAELRDPAAPAAACATSLVVSGAVLVLWFANPYAALVLVPAAHLWMLATLVQPRPPARARLLLIAGGLLPPLLVAVYYLVQLSIDPLSGAWYLVLLATGHSVGLITSLIACVLLGALASVVSISRAAGEEPPAARSDEDKQPVYGPGSYAGPGSLGGTESALRR
jgi:hypothetical protein